MVNALLRLVVNNRLKSIRPKTIIIRVCMPVPKKRGQIKTVLILCAASLTLTACGPRFHNAQVSANCPAYAQSCAPNNQSSRYGYTQSQQGYQQTYQQDGYEAYGSQYIQAYSPQPQIQYQAQPPIAPYVPPVTYVQSQESVVSYVPIAAPAPAPAPVYEPALVYDYQPEPIAEPSPPLTSWSPPWRDDPTCPEGTIQGYGGSGCVQVAIPRK